METLHLFGTPEQKEQLAGAAARGRDPLGVRDDRAGRRVVGCHQHRDQDRARRRRLRHQRPQVVDLRGGRRALPDLHRHGQDRHVRGRAHRQQSMVLVPRDTPGLEIVRHLPTFGYQDQHGHSEMTFDRRAGARDQPARRGGRRLRDRPGPAGPRAYPPLHAADRDGRAGDRPDGAAGAEPGGLRPPAGRPGRGAGADRPVADRGRAGPAAGAQDGLADRPLRRQGRGHGDRRDQGDRARGWPAR